MTVAIALTTSDLKESIRVCDISNTAIPVIGVVALVVLSKAVIPHFGTNQLLVSNWKKQLILVALHLSQFKILLIQDNSISF
ncbi:hypothetical protein JK635_01625 [Neobacillus sp. YIM B02564]|uniref:Uncharacterized protein n=1 Tax=Neobacillus paridis TaxID=2803862 RepID=A0ABS1TI05_9BACI|nr:hypothetical protein [Neobacillus paridis]MBL4950941.1 hypothetical protein [Neobacillus paridis]